MMNLLAKTALIFFVMLFSFCAIGAMTFSVLVWIDSHSTNTTGGAFVFILVPLFCGFVGALATGTLASHFLKRH